MSSSDFKNSDKYKRILGAEKSFIGVIKKALEDDCHPQNIYISLAYLATFGQVQIRKDLEHREEELRQIGYKSTEDYLWRMKHAAYKDFEADRPKIREDFKVLFKDIQK